MTTALVLLVAALWLASPAASRAADSRPAMQNIVWLQAPSARAETTSTLLLFWEPWCKPCAEAVSRLQRYTAPYGDSLSVVVITGENAGQAEHIRALLPNEWSIGIDTSSEARTGSHTPMLPYLMLLDSGGIVLLRGHPNAVSAGLLDSALHKLKPERAYDYEPMSLHSSAWNALAPNTADTAFARTGSFRAVDTSAVLAELSLRRVSRPSSLHKRSYLMYSDDWIQDSVLVLPALCTMVGKSAARVRVVGRPLFSCVEIQLQKNEKASHRKARKFVLAEMQNAFGFGRFDTTETRTVWTIVWASPDRATPFLDTTASVPRVSIRRAGARPRMHAVGMGYSLSESIVEWWSDSASFTEMAEALEKIFGEPVESDISGGEYYRLAFNGYTGSFATTRKEIEEKYGVRFVPVQKQIPITVFVFPPPIAGALADE